MKSLSAADLSQPKLPPQNLEAEQSVLGAVLLDNSAMAKAMELLVEENFYRTSNRKIYRAMLELSDLGEVIDQITLTERLKAQGEIEAVGGAAYLAELVQSVASSANIRYHCKIVRDKALLRELIHTSTEVLTRGYEGTSSVDDLLDFAERSVFSIAQGKLDRSFTPINSRGDRRAAQHGKDQPGAGDGSPCRHQCGYRGRNFQSGNVKAADRPAHVEFRGAGRCACPPDRQASERGLVASCGGGRPA